MIKPKSGMLSDVQASVCESLGYRKGSRKGKAADKATKYALQYLNQPAVTFAAHEYGLTRKEHIRNETESYVRDKMVGSAFLVSWLLSAIIGGIISAVVKMVVSWWIMDTLAQDGE